MRLTDLEIRNFKAITELALSDLEDAVVIAGPNGCGKSCVLDAIRLVKSAYGGYQQNEWHNWFGEFQIAFQQRSSEVVQLLQDPSREMRVTAALAFAPEELEYVRHNARDLLRAQAWREVAPELAGWRAFTAAPLAAHYRANAEEVERRAAAAHVALGNELSRARAVATVSISPTGEINIGQSRLLELMFSIYEPGKVGVLDFHSASRQYTRERVAGINLDLDNTREQRRGSALYNPQQKYAGLKAEMASAFVRQQLAKQAGSPADGQEDLVAALQDLFQTFFPGKSFVGPVPTADGRIEFPVTLPDGSTHDLDDLSSGEKEVLYGYMRLRSSAPKYSVVLVDEPELHLNPRLVRGLARFYYDHLVRAQANQLWLISHSDTLLREAINLEGFGVYHMRRAERSRAGENQLTRIATEAEAERLVIDLVGDLAAYRPGAKVVLFEGGGDVRFDVLVVTRLFPEIADQMNLIAAGNRKQVLALHRALEGIDPGALGTRFYAVHDRDSTPTTDPAAREFAWDAYHIENYLLEPEYVFRALTELTAADTSLTGPQDVKEALRACAERTVSSLVRHEMLVFANDLLVRLLDLGADPKATDVAAAMTPSVHGIVERVQSLATTELSTSSLETREQDLRKMYRQYLVTDEWTKTFRGRDILRAFVAQHVPGVKYEAFRDLVLARMKDAGYQPSGMASVLNDIAADPFP